MAAEFWVRDGGGTPHKLKELWIRDGGGVARLIKELWARDGGGTARKIFEYFAPVVGQIISSAIYVTNINPQLRLQPDGSSLTRYPDNSLVVANPWGVPSTPGIGANYWILVTLGAGSGTMTGTTGSLVSLSSEYILTMTAAPAGNARARLATYVIYSDAGGVNAVGSGSMDFESDRT
jgi:hypothetical protein